MKKNLCIIYDSIINSVFDSQIWNPLVKKARENPSQQFELISFEKYPEKIQEKLILMEKAKQSNITITVVERFGFFGVISFWPLISFLTSKFRSEKIDNVFCRGLFAGFIVLNALQKCTDKLEITSYDEDGPVWEAQECNWPEGKIEIYTPGIASEEFALLHQGQKGWKKYLYFVAQKMIHFMELETFRQAISLQDQIKISFSCPTTAMKEYWQEQEVAVYWNVINAGQEALIAKNKVAQYLKIRQELGLDPSTNIYAYSGSLHPWQNFEECIDLFMFRSKNTNAHLLALIVQSDLEAARQILQDKVPQHQYTLLSLPHHMVHEYLLACDFGILLRDDNVVNWTSKPIKALEYKNAGLVVVHNATVKWVVENC